MSANLSLCRLISVMLIKKHVCLTPAVVYNGHLTTETTTERYVGLCEPPFKNRHYKHDSSFRHVEQRNETTPSQRVWELREAGAPEPTITWSINSKSWPYRCGTRVCDLCLSETLSWKYQRYLRRRSPWTRGRSLWINADIVENINLSMHKLLPHPFTLFDFPPTLLLSKERGTALYVVFLSLQTFSLSNALYR